MAERVVKVSLRAEINNYLSGMEQARRKTGEVGTEAEKTAAKLEQQRQAFNLVGGTLLAAGTIAAAAVGVAVKKWMDFDQAMSAVAATGEDARASLDSLRDAALDAGARTVFSATEAANAIEELAKAGVNAGDILSGGLNGALDLAAAGGIEVADAAGIAATALQTFNLEGSDMTHVADLLAAGAGKAMGGVDDLGQALSQVGLVANGAGLSIEETTAGLAAFASQGLLGSDAGTSFKAMLGALTPNSAKAAEVMKELGLSAYDASGNFVGLEEFAGRLRTSFEDLTPEARAAKMEIIFGSDAVRAANALYSEGEAGIRDWIAAVDDQGFAAETAATRLDNLAGDWEQFGGAVETASIKAGAAADGPLRFLTQAATELVQSFADAPEGMQTTALAVGAVTAAVALGSGAFFVAIPKVVEYRAAIETLGPAAQRTSRLIGLAFKGIAIAGGTAVALTFVDQWLDSFKATNAELENTARTARSAEEALKAASKGIDVAYWGEVDTSVSGVKDALQAAADSAASWTGFLDMNLGQGGVLETLKQYGEGLGALARQDLPQAQDGFRRLTEQYELNATEQFRLLQNMPGYKDALVEQANALGLTADKSTLLKLAMGEGDTAARDNAAALAELQGAAVDTTGSVGELADAIRGFGSAELDTREAAREFQDALDALDESIAANGLTLDTSTEAGRANEAALDGIARAALESAGAIAEQTGSEDLAREAVQQGRDALLAKLETLGITGEEAQRYADKLGLIPSNIDTIITANTGPATAAADSFIERYQGKTITMFIAANGNAVSFDSVFKKADGGLMDFYARGGIRERHVAQIAPAGAWRVWAEPETGGESYIPLAPSKRARSLEVWAETGNRLGVPGFANGAVVPPVYAQSSWGGSSGGAPTVHREGDVFEIHEASNPVAVAQAVQNRQWLKGAV